MNKGVCRCFLPVMLLALMVSCRKEEEVEFSGMQDAESPLMQAAYAPGVAHVKFTEEMDALVGEDIQGGKIVTKSMELNQALDELGILSIERLFPEAGPYEPRTARTGLSRWYVIRYDESHPLTKAGNAFQNLPGVERYEGSRRVALTAFNDPMYSRQWHYFNDGSIGKAGADINVVPVWENYTTGSPEVIVAVVDGGLDLYHEDLQDNVIPASEEGSYNYLGHALSAHSHGTHVGGTIAAVSNNGKGVAGIAGGDAAAGQKGVRLLSCQVFETGNTGVERGGDETALVRAIKGAADKGAVICNNSWGNVYDFNEDGRVTGEELEYARNDRLSSAMKDAIDYFIDYAGCDNDGSQRADSPMKGGLVVFAAGNDDIEYCIPASYERVIAVGAFNSNGLRAYYSNYGDWVDIAAPGGDASVGYEVWSTLPQGEYGAYQGTSMACPHVSGVAALIVSRFGGAGFTADMLRTKLLEGADKEFIPASYRIGPKLDALGAMLYGLSGVPDAVPDYTLAVKSNHVDITWRLTGDDEGMIAMGYRALAAKSREALSGIDPSDPGSDVLYVDFASPRTGKVGDEITQRMEGLDFDTEYCFTLAAYSTSRQYSEISPIRSVTTGSNHAPSITAEAADPIEVRAFDLLRIPVTLADEDEHPLTWRYERASLADTFVEGSAEGSYYLVIDGNTAAKAGAYTSRLTVSDPYGLSAVRDFAFVLHENQAPEKFKDIGNQTFGTVGAEFVFNMDEYLKDPDGETLKFDITYSDKSVIYLNPVGGTIYGTVLRYGRTEVDIKAYDFKGESVETSFIAVVRDPSVAANAYPNPVVNTLYIGTGSEMQEADITVLSVTGKTVFDVKGLVCSAYYPASLDMSGCAPGKYKVSVEFDGKKVEIPIVKK